MNALDTYGVSGRVAEFDKRNGGNPVMINDWWVYPNGAMRETFALGALIDPPEDDYKRLTNILRYQQGRHAAAVRDFDNLQQQLIMAGHPDGEGLDRLKQLQQVVGQRNQAVIKAKADLDATPRGQQLARSKKFNAEMQQEEKEFKDQVRSIRI